MISKIVTATLIGLEVYKITVETDTNQSLPTVSIVGLPDIAVNEARERVRSAIKNSGFSFPSTKVVINLAPADIKKEGSLYDLPIAIGILVKTGIMEQAEFKDTAFIGELSLDGSLRSVRGILPIAEGLSKQGIKNIFVPYENAKEAALIPNINVYGAKNLSQIVHHFSNKPEISEKIPQTKVDVEEYLNKSEAEDFLYDFKDVKGQQKAKKALEIAAAGGHNVLMSGPPGSGKTLLSKCFASILPPMQLEEAIEISKIYSVAGLLDNKNPLMTKRPFRPVHHTASAIGIIGGGSNPKPGEITLSHRGVLFLDELVEFPRNVLEVLRQPLEDRNVVISRAQTRVCFPADFILLAAMNPCPCGYLGDFEKKCTCTDFQISRYRSKLSGPLLDRIDIQIEVPRLKVDDLLNKNEDCEDSKTIRERVIKARKRQYERYKDYKIYTNSELSAKLIKKFCKTDDDSSELLREAVKNFNISGRAYDRILKIARTIADLDDCDDIKLAHVAQAIQFRNFIEPETSAI